MRRHVTALLVAVNAALALLLAAMWVTPEGKLRNVAWQPPAAIKPEFSAALTTNSEMNIGGFMATVDRPLFSPNRLPPPVKAASAAAPPVDPLANIRLHGVYVGQGIGGIIATVDGKSRRIRLNEPVGEWTVASIKDREVTFTRAGESRVIRLASSTGSQHSTVAGVGAAQAPAAGPRDPRQRRVEARVPERLRPGRTR